MKPRQERQAADANMSAMVGAASPDTHALLDLWAGLTDMAPSGWSASLLKRRGKTTVYRLVDRSGLHSPVIAKRSAAATLHLESTIYREVLPFVAARTPEFFGLAESPSGSWLFIEEIQGARFSRRDPSHLSALARWLADLHIGAPDMTKWKGLPTRNASFYRELLNETCDVLSSGLSGTRDCARERALLVRLLGDLDQARSSWPSLEPLIDRSPTTLVHNDTQKDNVRIIDEGGGLAAVAFDWEWCGVGAILADLPKLHGYPGILAAYHRSIRVRWPHLSLHEIERSAGLGAFFRTVLAIRWEAYSLSLPFDRRGQMLDHLESFADRLTALLPELER